MTGATAVAGRAHRCALCGAAQDPRLIEAPFCGVCGQKLKLAKPPVIRGPAGWCAVHPDQPLTGVCARCGAFTCVSCEVSIRGLRYCERCQEALADQIVTPVPWEDRAQIGRLRAWWRTTVAVTTKPAHFFDRMDPTSHMGAAFSYGFIGVLLTISAQSLLMLLTLGGMGVLFVIIGLANSSSQSGPPALMGLGMFGYALVLVIGSFVAVILGYLIITLMQHMTLRIFGAGKEHGLTATLKVACYALGTGWCGLVPYMGQYLHPFWWTALMVVGTAKVHRCSYTRSLSVIIPTVMVCVAPIAAYVLMIFVVIIAEAL